MCDSKQYIHKERLVGLDFLKGIAILLTLCRHFFQTPNVFWNVGWTGVHLFFILSSFLIATVLLNEYSKTGKINFSSFFIRRALKIYPIYYLFIFISVISKNNFASKNYRYELFGQLFHVQNYTGLLWFHTWSLAVEEQFYIVFSIILLIFIFFSCINNLNKFSWLFSIIIVLAPILRYNSTLLYHTEWFPQTHYIMDSFAFGILLAMFKFTSPKLLKSVIMLKHYLLIPIIILLLPVFILSPGNLFINTIGISMMYLAITILITYFLSIENILREKNIFSKIIVTPIASIGIASYSIYIFHIPLKSIIDLLIPRKEFKIGIEFLGCILSGKLIWYLVEKPIFLYKSKKYSFKNQHSIIIKK